MCGLTPVRVSFDYPLKLHHTQTTDIHAQRHLQFDYPLKLHHTQTSFTENNHVRRFDYPLKLHHTQTSNLKSEYFYAPHASIQRTECNYLYYSIKSYSDNDFAQIFVNQSDKFFVCFIFQSIFQKKETNILQLRLIVKTFQILFV